MDKKLASEVLTGLSNFEVQNLKRFVRTHEANAVQYQRAVDTLEWVDSIEALVLTHDRTVWDDDDRQYIQSTRPGREFRTRIGHVLEKNQRSNN
jgi:hypothetical protein